MSEVDTETFDEIDLGPDGVIGEVTPNDIDLEKNNINDFINAIQNKEFTKANTQFDDMVSDRLQDALDQAKLRIAGQIYNNEPEESEEPDED